MARKRSDDYPTREERRRQRAYDAIVAKVNQVRWRQNLPPLNYRGRGQR